MRKALDGYDGGIGIGGRRISNIRYADDTVLFAKTEADMMEYQLMIIDRNNNATSALIKDIPLKRDVIYLGVKLNDKGG